MLTICRIFQCPALLIYFIGIATFPNILAASESSAPQNSPNASSTAKVNGESGYSKFSQKAEKNRRFIADRAKKLRGHVKQSASMPSKEGQKRSTNTLRPSAAPFPRLAPLPQIARFRQSRE